MTYVGSRQHGNAVARCCQNETQCRKDDHDHETLRPAPDIEELGYRHEHCRRHGAGHDRDHVEQRVAIKGACSVGQKAAQNS